MSNSRAERNNDIENISVCLDKSTVAFDEPGNFPDWMVEDVYEHAVNSPGHTYLVTDKENVLGEYDAVFRRSERRSSKGSGRVQNWEMFREELSEADQVRIEGDLKAALETYDDTIEEISEEKTVFANPDHIYVLLETENDGISEEYATVSQIRSQDRAFPRYNVESSYRGLVSELEEGEIGIGRWNKEGEFERIGRDGRLTSPGFQPSYRQSQD